MESLWPVDPADVALPSTVWAFVCLLELRDGSFQLLGHASGVVDTDAASLLWYGATAHDSEAAELLAIFWALLWLSCISSLWESLLLKPVIVSHFDCTSMGGAVW